MKKIFLRLLTTIMVVSGIFTLIACDNQPNTEKPPITEHTHAYSKDWSKDKDYHWHSSTCGHESEISEKALHDFGDWQVVTPATEETNGLQEQKCKVCDYTKTQTIDKLEHTHKYSKDWSKDEDYHWYSSTCGHESEISEKALHNFGDWQVVTPATEETNGLQEQKCNVCDYTKTQSIDKLAHTHKYSKVWSKDKYFHWHSSTCGHENEVSEKALHDFGDWQVITAVSEEHDGLQKRQCSVCDYEDELIVKVQDVSEVTIPENVTYLSKAFFDGYVKKHITELIIPNTVTSIEKGALAELTALQKLTILSSNKCSLLGELFGEIAGGTEQYKLTYNQNTIDFTQLPSKYYNIPATLTEVTIGGNIPFCYFVNCQNVTTINLANVTEIGKCAFYGSYLTSIDLAGVTVIDMFAFKNSKLASVFIPETVETLGNQAFENCVDLTSVIFDEMAKVEQFPAKVFAGCDNLETLILNRFVTLVVDNVFDSNISANIYYYDFGQEIEIPMIGKVTEFMLVDSAKMLSSGGTNIVLLDKEETFANATFYKFTTVETPTISGNYWYYDTNGQVKTVIV